MRKLFFNLAILASMLFVSTSYAANICIDIFSIRRLEARYESLIENRTDKTPLSNFVEKTPNLETMQVEIKPLKSGQEALAARIAVIERAEVSIDISYYILKRDSAGYALLNAIQGAIARGVKVRIMVDGAGSFHPTHTELLALLSMNKGLPKPLVEVKLINPLFSVQNTLRKFYSLIFEGKWNFDPISLNNRSHDKIILIDAGTKNSWLITGGRNMGDNYFGVNGKAKEILDYDVLIKGGAVGSQNDPLLAIQSYYEALFHHRLNLALTGRVWGLFKNNSETEFVKMQAGAQKIEEIKRFGVQLGRARQDKFWNNGFEKTSTTLVTEVQNILKQHREKFDAKHWMYTGSRMSITRSLFEVFAEAKKSVKLVSPYALFSKSDVEAIRDWLLADPTRTFDIYSASLNSNDNAFSYAMFHVGTLPRLQALQRDPMIGDRLQIFLFDRTRLMHAKFVIVDSSTALVTTSNFDPRSRMHNSEIGFWDDSVKNVGALNQKLLEIEAGSTIAPPTGRVLRAKDQTERAKQELLLYMTRALRLIGAESLM